MTSILTEDLDIAAVLELQAQERPDAPCILCPREQREASYGDLDELANRFANGLLALGVTPGACVAQFLANSLDGVISAYGIKKLGCIEVAVNVEFRGAALARMVNLTEAEILVTSGELVPALEAVFADLTSVRTVVLVGGDPDDVRALLPGVRVVAFAELLQASSQRPNRQVRPGDIQAIYFTSGTTGVSKGCMLSHRYALRFSRNHIGPLGLTEDDRAYCPWPLHHVTAAYSDILAMLLVGGSTVLLPRFSLSRFWPEICETESTYVELVGTVPRLLLLGEPTPLERNHRLRVVPVQPLPPDIDAFQERFGITISGLFGSTDAGVVSARSDPPPNGDRTNVGTVRPDLDVAILDEEDRVLPQGEQGEIAVRARVPDILSSGYYGMADATLSSRRNLWFHTGDVGYVDADGDLHFLGRKQERIRRGGENVSVYEVQEILEAHVAVAQSAVVPVPSDLGEDDVHAFVRLTPDGAAEPDDLLEHCRARMAKFMVPSTITILDELPITPTGKVAIRDLIDRVQSASARS